MYSGSPDSRLATKRSLNTPRVLPSRTNFARSAPNSTLKMASGLASSIAWTMTPASTLPSGGACSVTISASGCAFFSNSLKRSAADWPYSKFG